MSSDPRSLDRGGGAGEEAAPRPDHPKASSKTKDKRHPLDRGRDRFEGTFTGLLLGTGLLLVVYTVCVRYFAPAFAPVYTDEIVVYIVMWAALLACSGVTHSRTHVRADLVTYLMPQRLRHLLEVAANLAGFGFALFLAWFGWLVAYEAWDFGDLSPTNLRFPLWIYYAALPVAAVLIAIGHLRVAVELILRGPDDDPPSNIEEVQK